MLKTRMLTASAIFSAAILSVAGCGGAKPNTEMLQAFSDIKSQVTAVVEGLKEGDISGVHEILHHGTIHDLLKGLPAMATDAGLGDTLAKGLEAAKAKLSEELTSLDSTLHSTDELDESQLSEFAEKISTALDGLVSLLPSGLSLPEPSPGDSDHDEDHEEHADGDDDHDGEGDSNPLEIRTGELK